jgi:beta-1,4-mannooligosaccharide/beta-1,4-mannosyl-N-acetylglucosamine phosphorylase
MITKFRGEEYIMHRHQDGPILTVEDFPVPAQAVFNCGQIMHEGKYLLLIAAYYQKPLNGNMTGIHVATSEDGVHFDINPEPLFKKRDWAGDCPGKYDNWVIDPRVTKIEDTYYVVRPAQVPGLGAAAVLEKTKDFKTAEFVECIAMPGNRVPCLFPEKINGDYVRLDRPYNIVRVDPPGHRLDDQLKAGIWMSYSPDLIHWGRHRPLFNPPLSYANYKLGPTPPIRTKDGWLEIIHGVYKENREWCYSLGAMLLDINDPSKILGVLDKPILTPNFPYEYEGREENVVFACGAIVNEEKDEIRIYYGAADTCIGLATGSLTELLEELKKSPNPHVRDDI